MEFEVKILEEAEKFIYKLPIKMQAKIRRTIELLKKF
jgi:mRNA-degrading endonuclease RelE of RelBE toxin-antitoxin system